MFKPKQPQSNNNQPPTRQRLPLVDRAPRQEDIAALFTGAMRIKGCSFELPVQPTIHSKIYLVTCQFDNFTNETVWSMYEGEQGSLQLWTCPHSDLDLVFDMVCMSAGTNKGAGSMPAEVAQSAVQAQPGPAPAPQYPPPAPAPTYPPGQYSSPHQVYPPQPQPQPYSQPYPVPQQYPPQPQTPYNAPYPSGQPYPPQQNQYPQQPAPYPQQSPTQPYPGQQDWTQQPPPQQQPFYQQPTGSPGWGAQPAQSPYQQQPYTPSSAPASTPTAAPGSSPQSVPLVTPEISNFIDLINKGTPNLLLGHLFVEAGIVPEKCLDAALKCQELVRNGKLTNEQAVLALRRAAELGGILDDDVVAWAKDPEGARLKSARTSAHRGQTPEEQPYTPPLTSAFEPNKPIQATPPKPLAGVSRDVSAMQKVIELLKQAGLVSEADVETARKVRSKHGGDLGQILVSAGKVGAQTMEAASRCQELVTNGRLRIDKAINALHYCERMRAGLDDALEELHIELL